MRAVLGLAVLLTSCGGGAEVAASCGTFACPAGTAPVATASASQGFDVSGSVDPEAYDGGVAIRYFGFGACSYACEAYAACPSGTWPVLTQSCFTCATVNDDGEAVQGSCGDVGGSAAFDPAADGGDCASDLECPGGYRCDTVFSQRCKESCVGDIDCKAGFRCGDLGACVLPECSSDSDCGAGFGCDVFHECEERCITDANCASGFVCDDAGACVVPGCTTDDDCGGGACLGGECSGGCATAPAAPSWAAIAAALSALRLGARRHRRRGSHPTG